MAPASKTNGSLAVARWVGIGLTVAAMLVASVVFAVTISDKTDDNCEKIKKIEVEQADSRKMLHRMDKRLVLIMHKMGVVDHGDPGDPGTPD